MLNTSWIKENWKVLLTVAIILAGLLTGGGLYASNVNDRLDSHDASIETIFDTMATDKELSDAISPIRADLLALTERMNAHLIAYAAYTAANDEAIKTIQADIADINVWITAFYSDDPEALGEWQEFLKDWQEFQDDMNSEINAITSSWSNWYSKIEARLTAGGL